MAYARDLGHRVLEEAVGRRLVDVARAHHLHRGRVDESRGALELAFEGGPVLHLTTAANGESVWVRQGAWFDPVSDPDQPPSPEWIAEAGEWIRVDVRGRPGYADVVGRRLTGVRWLVNEHGSVAGVELRFGGPVLTFVSWGDEEHVVTGDASAVPQEWGMRVLAADEPTAEGR